MKVNKSMFLCALLLFFTPAYDSVGQDASIDAGFVRQLLRQKPLIPPKSETIRDTKVMSILDGDVETYFKLAAMSELKRKDFQQSSKYKKLVDSLDARRNALLTDWSYLKLKIISDYDLAHGSFDIYEGSNVGNGTAYSSCPKTVGNVALDDMEWSTEPGSWVKLGVDGAENTNLVFRCDEATAKEIEGARKNLDALVIFKIDGASKKTFKFFSITPFAWFNITTDVVKTRDPVLVIWNRVNSKIVFQKSYATKWHAPMILER